MTTEEKLKKAAELLKPSEKQFGKGSMSTLGEKTEMNIEVIPTGSLGLDIALGIGGLPKGRIVEILGMESSGKTTLCTHIIAEAQKKGEICAFVDAEHAFDKKYASQIGVNVNELQFYQPDSGEDALNYVETLLDTKLFGVIVVDSVAALTPQKEIEGQIGDSTIGLQARMMSQAMRKLASKVSKSSCVLIFINQWREKIGVMFGSPLTPSGGNALKFYTSVRLDVTRSTTIANTVVENDIKVGNLTKVKVLKNKVAPPFNDCEFNIRYGVGIDQVDELFDLALKYEIIEKDKTTFSYKGSKLAVGKDATYEIMRDNIEMQEEIKNDIRQLYGI